VTQLEVREEALRRQIAEISARMAQIGAFLDRILLIEVEYSVAMLKAEARWVQQLLNELRSGRFTWDPQKILRQVRAARRKAATRKERSE
jgi:hypothetical protein